MSTQYDDDDRRQLKAARQFRSAIRRADNSLVRLRELLSGPSVQAVKDDDIHEALSIAARRGRVDACRLLWKELSLRGKQMYFAAKYVRHCTSSPLHEAVENGHFEVVRLFIEEFHFNINQMQMHSYTPLRCACKSYNMELILYLLEHGAHVNRGGTMNPLWNAVVWGETDIVRLLLEHGADPNFNRKNPAIKEEDGNDDADADADANANQDWCPCNTDNAIEIGNPEILSMLLQHGAYVGDGNHDGSRIDGSRYTSLSSLLLEQDEGHEVKLSICRILIEHAETDDATAVFLEMSFKNIIMKESGMEYCALLLDAGLDVDRISAMYWAIQAKNDSACRLLVHQYHVNPFAQDDSNKSYRLFGENEEPTHHAPGSLSSPFLAAAHLQDTAILRFFLEQWDERFVTSSGKNDHGEYPIHVLCHYKHVSLQALVLLLQERKQAFTLTLMTAKEEFAGFSLPFVSAAMSDANLDVIFYLLQQCPDALSRLVSLITTAEQAN